MNPLGPREIAVRILQRRAGAQEYTEDLLHQNSDAATLSGPDRALLQELAYGVVRWQATLDWLIARRNPGRTQKPLLQILLRLGLYQLFWLERIPEHAAVHESVELAKRLGLGPQAGFLNAFLRGSIRERASIQSALQALQAEQSALGYSHPDWLVARWEGRWGRDATVQQLRWNNHPAGTFARVNTLRITSPDLLARWTAEGVTAFPCSYEWAGPDLVYRLASHPPLRQLPSFRDGGFYVQDPSTLLAVQVLDPQPGESILDLCAAPGGKTTFMAQRMGNQGRIVASDFQPARLALIRENCARLGVTIAEPILVATSPGKDASAKFDRVLLDAPCSNTGVLRRRVDLRWRVRPTEVARLQSTQAKLLREAAAQVRKAGVLVYSTCSLEPEENTEVIRQFLAEDTRFQLESERELLPFREDVDGAYVARLRRK